jgi:hypothetical protein
VGLVHKSHTEVKQVILTLTRKWCSSKSTIGELAIDGVFFCYTLEDVARETKIPGETAIPVGGYDVVITMSNRFKKRMPLLKDVPGFEGVRIHSGNFPKDTEGCILVGLNRGEDQIMDSRLAYDKLFRILDETLEAGETVRIVIS